jgi:hypothetical protein
MRFENDMRVDVMISRQDKRIHCDIFPHHEFIEQERFGTNVREGIALPDNQGCQRPR